jgi:hypothetical protein
MDFVPLAGISAVAKHVADVAHHDRRLRHRPPSALATRVQWSRFSGAWRARNTLAGATDQSSVLRATDFSLTHGEYRIQWGKACRAKPKRGAASAMSPNLSPLPCPVCQPPLKLTGQHELPVPRTLSAHRKVSTPYPLSRWFSRAMLLLGHKSRSR